MSPDQLLEQVQHATIHSGVFMNPLVRGRESADVMAFHMEFILHGSSMHESIRVFDVSRSPSITGHRSLTGTEGDLGQSEMIVYCTSCHSELFYTFLHLSAPFCTFPCLSKHHTFLHFSKLSKSRTFPHFSSFLTSLGPKLFHTFPDSALLQTPHLSTLFQTPHSPE